MGSGALRTNLREARAGGSRALSQPGYVVRSCPPKPGYGLDIVAHAFKFQRTEGRGRLHLEFQASQGYTERPYFKTKQKNKQSHGGWVGGWVERPPLKLCLGLFWLQEMDGPGESDPDLRPADHPRFCEEIKRNLPSYAAHFTRVFQNKTFHVYRLSRNK